MNTDRTSTIESIDSDVVVIGAGGAGLAAAVAVSGMGLGLSMVATQVWSLGGTCRSYNRDDGPGIVVELVLPCSD